MFRDLRQTTADARLTMETARTELVTVTESIDRATRVVAVVVCAFLLVSVVALMLNAENSIRLNQLAAQR